MIGDEGAVLYRLVGNSGDDEAEEDDDEGVNVGRRV